MSTELYLDISDLDVSRAQKNRGTELEKLLWVTTPYVINLSKKWTRPPLDPFDISQEALLRIAQNIESFKFKSKFSTWVYTITYRTFLDESRKIKRREKIAQIIPLENETDKALKENEEEDIFAIVHDLIEKLPPQMQEVIVMIDVQNLSYQQASQELKVPIGTVRSRLARARIAIKALLEKDGTFQAGKGVLIDEVNNEISD